jgi:hypothetical protein
MEFEAANTMEKMGSMRELNTMTFFYGNYPKT